MLPKFQKPPSCADCQLHDRGFGFAPAVGPAASPLLFVGEALGYNEAVQGEPFVGAAGGMLGRIFSRAQVSRSQVRIHNTVNCRPPEDWLEGAPWQHSALTHCAPYLQESLDSPHLKVVVTLGNTPMRQILNLWGVDGVRLQDFHGTIHRSPDDRFWVVPTFHPSHLQRGAINLLDVVRRDVTTAMQILHRGGIVTRRPFQLHRDPPFAWFQAWAAQFLARLAHEGFGWLSADIETPDKSGGRDEGELSSEDTSTQILRINFAGHGEEGITVPWVEPYIGICRQLLNSGAWLALWNKAYDESRLRFNGIPFQSATGEPITLIDGMWAAHHLQSDLPLGLGFWAPLYSDYGAWKHLGKQRGSEAEYAAIDGLQTYRIVAEGIVPDLQKEGLWDAFWRHTHLREQYVLRPARQNGMPVDEGKLDQFHEKLQTYAAAQLTAINDLGMASTLHPKLGYPKPPRGKDGQPPTPPAGISGAKHRAKGDHAKADYIDAGIRLVEREIPIPYTYCSGCGEALKQPHDACSGGPDHPDAERGPEVPLVTLPVPERRWFWQLPFNPDANAQILRFIRDSGETPGKAKKTKKDTANKETLRKLKKSTGNPIYQHILDYKAVKKVDSTYALGLKKRIWRTDGRIHPEITFRPSMFRDSCINPNIQNVIADKEGKDSLAAGLRFCMVARPGWRFVEIDYCVDPNVKILTQDLRWIPAGEIEPGTPIVGFHEQTFRTFEPAAISRVRRITRPRVRVRTTAGEVVVSAEHRFVGRPHKGRRRWIEAKDLRPGMQLSYLAAPWAQDTSYDAGYLAGLFDGEGWVSGTCVGYAQKEGPILDHVRGLLDERGFSFTAQDNNSTAVCELTRGLRDAMRFLGTIRPKRLLAKSDSLWVGRRTWGSRTPIVKVVSVEPLPDGEVIAITTTSGTLITDGYFSHNCGTEAVDTGWYIGDPRYIRLATLGVHAYLTSHLLYEAKQISEPASLDWTDQDLAAFFKSIKKRFQETYDKAKRCVHGNNYGLTVYGMVENFPDVFTGGKKEAEHIQALYYSLAPGLPAFHQRLRDVAYETEQIGGSYVDDYQALVSGRHHPFGYRHKFYGVMSFRPLSETEYRKLQWVAHNKLKVARHPRVRMINNRPFEAVLGEDSKRVIAMYPQSTSAGKLKEAELALLHPDSPDYVGEWAEGKTPLCAPIHDSLLFHVPDQGHEEFVYHAVEVMRRPLLQMPCPAEWGMGSHIRTNVEVKISPVGGSWGDTSVMAIPDMLPETATESLYLPDDPDEWEDVQDLETKFRDVDVVVGARK